MAVTPRRGCSPLRSQKSRRFCYLAKSPTSFDPATITSGCLQPLMSAPASVPRVARPSEATAFARSAYITDIIFFFMLCAIATVVNSALVKILPPQQGDRPVRRGRRSVLGQMKSLRSGGAMWGVFPVADAVLSFRVHMWALRPVEFAEGFPRVYAASPFEGRCSVSGRGRGRRSVRVCLPSICPGGAAVYPSGFRCHRTS